MAGEDDAARLALAVLLGTAAQALEASSERRDTYSVVTSQACKVIPGAEWACISVTHLDGARDAVAATHSIAERAEEAQRIYQEGPCSDSSRLRSIVSSADLATDLRYPTYGPVAEALGIRSQLAAEVFTAGPNRASLNLYSGKPDAFTTSIHVAELFSSLAAVALGFASSVSDLDDALESRSRIGQAIGIVQERFKLDEHKAFAYLIRSSQDSNTKMRAVAEKIIATVEVDKS